MAVSGKGGEAPLGVPRAASDEGATMGGVARAQLCRESSGAQGGFPQNRRHAGTCEAPAKKVVHAVQLSLTEHLV